MNRCIIASLLAREVMYLPQSYQVALLFMVASMLCWGSWANTMKLCPGYRFQLFYWDYISLSRYVLPQCQVTGRVFRACFRCVPVRQRNGAQAPARSSD